MQIHYLLLVQRWMKSKLNNKNKLIIWTDSLIIIIKKKCIKIKINKKM